MIKNRILASKMAQWVKLPASITYVCSLECTYVYGGRRELIIVYTYMCILHTDKLYKYIILMYNIYVYIYTFIILSYIILSWYVCED